MTVKTIIRLPEVRKRTGLSRSSIYALIKQGKFKAPIHIGSRAVGWLSTDVDEYIDARVAASREIEK
jgi:prophage regulatory protein